MLNGKIAAIGTPLEITASGAGLTKISVKTQNGSVLKQNLQFPSVSQRVTKEDYEIFFSTNITATLIALIAEIEAQGDLLIDLRVERPSLEDRFLEITNIGGAE